MKKKRTIHPESAGEKRAALAAEISARNYADIIAGEVRTKIERYINLEILSTDKDDHTRSLSERVAHMETQLGELRWELKWMMEKLKELHRLEIDKKRMLMGIMGVPLEGEDNGVAL